MMRWLALLALVTSPALADGRARRCRLDRQRHHHQAVADPDVQGVTCHLAYFDRSVIDRLQQGNWFEGSVELGHRMCADRADQDRRYPPRTQEARTCSAPRAR